MIFIERQYISRISTTLENFRQRRHDLYVCSCPICGDVSKGKKKVRFGIFIHGNADHFNTRCFHCGWSSSFKNFLKFKFPHLYEEYTLDLLRERNEERRLFESLRSTHASKTTNQPIVHVPFNKELLTPVTNLSNNHPAKQYLAHRKIPLRAYTYFYYTPRYFSYANSVVPDKFPKELVNDKDHDRLVLIGFDHDGKTPVVIQSRALNDDIKPKYYTIKLRDHDAVFGLDRVDINQDFFVTEGPIDSLFLTNAIAVMGSTFDVDFVRKHRDRAIIVFDNEPRNREIMKQMQRIIESGYRVSFYDTWFMHKDINEAVMAGVDSNAIECMLRRNVAQGSEALLRFVNYKKV